MTKERAKQIMANYDLNNPEVNRKLFEYGEVAEAFEIAVEALEQEPKTGHWEWVQYDGNPEIGNFHCSECRYIPAIFNMSAQKLNYCPKCGAKMQ